MGDFRTEDPPQSFTIEKVSIPMRDYGGFSPQLTNVETRLTRFNPYEGLWGIFALEEYADKLSPQGFNPYEGLWGIFAPEPSEVSAESESKPFQSL